MALADNQTAHETRQLWEDMLSDASDWREEAWDNYNFVHGIQWTTEQAEKLRQRGQYPYKIDIISPMIENKVATVMSTEPTWDIRPTGWGADEYRARVRQMILKNIWRYSDGRTVFRDACEASFVCGRGCVGVRFDPLADYGAGEIVLFNVQNPHEILVPADCTRRDWEDADDLIFWKIMTIDQAKRWFSDKEWWSAIESQKGIDIDPNVSHKTNRYAGEGQKHPDDLQTKTDKVIIRERYSKEIATVHVLTPIVQGLQNKEVDTLSDDDKGNIANGYYLETVVRRPRIKQICCVGNEFLYDNELPITHYPFSPVVCRHTGNPYSLGEVHRAKDQQISINKRHAVLLHIVSTSANPRVIYPEGSINKDFWADQAALPGALLPYYPQYDGGKPSEMTMNVATPVSVLAKMMEMDRYNAQFSMGVFDPDMGSSRDAPRALGQTLVYKRNQEKRLRDFSATSLDPSILKMAWVALEMVPSSYTAEKLKKIVDAELNDPGLTDSQKQYLTVIENYADELLKDVTLGRYSIQIVPGSTMDEDPLAIQQHFIELANIGMGDREAIIRQDPYIKDKEGWIQRLNERDQLKAQVQQLDQITKQQSQVIKIQENEIRHAKTDRDVAAHKAALKGEEFKARSHVKLMKDRMDLTQKIKETESNRTAKIQKKSKE